MVGSDHTHQAPQYAHALDTPSHSATLRHAAPRHTCKHAQGEAGLTDDRLAHALSNLPPRSLALLEDVDAAFVQRDATDHSQSRSYVTFSGLLNALDGTYDSNPTRQRDGPATAHCVGFLSSAEPL